MPRHRLRSTHFCLGMLTDQPTGVAILMNNLSSKRTYPQFWW